MKFLTKEWRRLCAMQELRFELRVHKDVVVFDEGLFQRLYKRKEKGFLKQEKEFYEYCLEGTYNREESIKRFEEFQKCRLEANGNSIPKKIYRQIADPRVFALGYCTREIKNQIIALSKESESKVRKIVEACNKSQREESIPNEIRDHFRFHDSKVIEVEYKRNITISLHPSGYTENNRIIFYDAVITQQDRSIDGCLWMYNELYKTKDGYEVHMTFLDGVNSYIEMTIRAKNIKIDKK